MNKIMVTGGSGYFGTWVVKDLVRAGYEVLNVDAKRPNEWLCPVVVIDLNDAGQVWGAMSRFRPDAVVHLAAIPDPKGFPDSVTLRNNLMTTYHILEAAAGCGVQKVALASSDSTYGVVFSQKSASPQYVPIDEEHPQLPEDAYGFSKLMNEETAKMMHRKTGMQIVCLRFVHIAAPDHYKRYPGFNRDIASPQARGRIREVWNYVDARDGARACRLAVEKDGLGYCAVNIVANETCMDVETKALLSTYHPGVKVFKASMEGFASFTSNKKAFEILGWAPEHSWRDGVEA